MTLKSFWAARRGMALALAVAVAGCVSLSAAFAQGSGVQLFKIVSAKDEIVVGLSTEELAALGGSDAPALARALKEKGTLGLWQYATRKAASGELEQAPLRKIGVLAQDSLRVEPYKTPLKVLPHD